MLVPENLHRENEAWVDTEISRVMAEGYSNSDTHAILLCHCINIIKEIIC
jgi:hypothetical protein